MTPVTCVIHSPHKPYLYFYNDMAPRYAVTTVFCDNNREPFQFVNNGFRAKLAGCSVHSSQKVDESKQTAEREDLSMPDKVTYLEIRSFANGSVLGRGVAVGRVGPRSGD